MCDIKTELQKQKSRNKKNSKIMQDMCRKAFVKAIILKLITCSITSKCPREQRKGNI